MIIDDGLVELLGSPPTALREDFEKAIAGVIAGGANPPPWIAVDDGGDGWVIEASSRPLEERRRAVAAIGDERSLLVALRLEIGGALSLPISALGLLEALAAAATPRQEVQRADASLTGSIDCDGGCTVVTFEGLRFWHSQLGRGVLESLLIELAAGLGVPPAIMTWPALVVSQEIDGGGLADFWKAVVAAGDRPVPGLAVFESAPATSTTLDAAYRALNSNAPIFELPGTVGPLPVHELPSGEKVGTWSLRSAPEKGSIWNAFPSRDGDPCEWILGGSRDRGVVPQVKTTEEIVSADTLAAVQVPGWITRHLRPGTPAALLVARLAESAAHRDVPLWIPNIDSDGLHFALCLPGTLWVDGPAVPR